MVRGHIQRSCERGGRATYRTGWWVRIEPGAWRVGLPSVVTENDTNQDETESSISAEASYASFRVFSVNRTLIDV